MAVLQVRRHPGGGEVPPPLQRSIREEVDGPYSIISAAESGRRKTLPLSSRPFREEVEWPYSNFVRRHPGGGEVPPPLSRVSPGGGERSAQCQNRSKGGEEPVPNRIQLRP